jgi:hypothetical protein
MAHARRARILTCGATLALAGGVVAGCGAQDTAKHAASDAKNAIDPVAQASAATSAQKGGIALTMKGTVSAAGQDVPIDGGGVVDRAGKRGKLSITTAAAGQNLRIDEIIDGKVLYIGGDTFAKQLPGGKKWVKLDLAKEASKQGIDLDSLGGGATQDPAGVLDYLKGAGTSRKVGTATVNGTQTTRYHAEVDLRKAAAKSSDPDAKASVDKVLKLLGRDTLPIDVWVDADHLVRREQVAYSTTTQGQKSSVDLTVDYTKFGVDVDADPPPAGQVADFSDLVGGAAKDGSA